jgi:hypothetical protein
MRCMVRYTCIICEFLSYNASYAHIAYHLCIICHIMHYVVYCTCIYNIRTCVPVWCRFVGWITNFIRQRHRAAASLVHAYSRLTFVRRMPPTIRCRLQTRQKTHTMNTSMRSYIAPYTPHDGRGSEKLHVKPANWRNAKPLLERNRLRLHRSIYTTNQITHYTIYCTT